MDNNEKRRRNERLANRLKQLEDEIEATKRKIEREEGERLDREAHRMEGLIAVRETSLAELLASAEPCRETERTHNEETQASGQQREISPDNPRPSTSKESERWETREVRWEHTFEEESTDEECPQWEVRSPSKTTTKLIWSEVYSSSTSRTPSPKKKETNKATDTTENKTDSKLQAKAVVKLNRLEEIDTSLILDSKRRTTTSAKTRHQVDTRTKNQKRTDERIMRWIGKESRSGGHHHRKALTKDKVQETWRIKAHGVPPGEATMIRLERERRRKAMTTAARKTGFGRLFRILSTSDIEESDDDEPAPVPIADTSPGGRVQQKAAAGAVAASTPKATAESGRHRGSGDDRPRPLPRVVSRSLWRAEARTDTGAGVGDAEVASGNERPQPNLTRPYPTPERVSSEPAYVGTRPSEPEERERRPSEPTQLKLSGLERDAQGRLEQPTTSGEPGRTKDPDTSETTEPRRTIPGRLQVPQERPGNAPGSEPETPGRLEQPTTSGEPGRTKDPDTSETTEPRRTIPGRLQVPQERPGNAPGSEPETPPSEPPTRTYQPSEPPTRTYQPSELLVSTAESPEPASRTTTPREDEGMSEVLHLDEEFLRPPWIPAEDEATP
ncbi:serine/arginine repetitive matrix protein 1-like [Odontomachus brunneus]|uniref:serine/arginine repetitive matrix protein 1-like n=1 Tax=Odontomachus brunneus TaxID=486640 RepID=UPI0013F281DC|nr:serine/arginine repetitive matrix protein 1-like [Odontomachus brunneus]